MGIRKEVVPFAGGAVILGACIGFVTGSWLAGLCISVVVTACLAFFFRDPDRTLPADGSAIVSGADGRVMSVSPVNENMYMHVSCIRISVFLSIFDVHVNRAPLSGQATFLGHFPGIRAFAFREKASAMNQHNKILIEGEETSCMVVQIVGPIARRVVYWLDQVASTPVRAGERIGMMKFGSRLDVYLPIADVDVLTRTGERVRAGETVIARLKQAKQSVARAAGSGEIPTRMGADPMDTATYLKCQLGSGRHGQSK